MALTVKAKKLQEDDRADLGLEQYNTIEEATTAKCTAMKKTLEGVERKKLSEIVGRQAVS